MNCQILQKAVSFVILAGFMILCASPSYAQNFLTGFSPDPETLVSAPPRAYLLQSKQNFQASLVDIKAVEVPVMRSENGRTGMASTEHYGHGIIIDSSGIIVTNTHIIANSQHIYVDLGGNNVFEAEVLYSSKSDFSFIKIDAPYRLRTIAWGDSSRVQIGNPVIAFAHSDPDSQCTLGGQVTSLIKGKHSGNVNILQLKLNLKPGDSGGPILDEQGCWVGLIMASQKSDGSQSYAIASNKIQKEYFKYKGSVLVSTSTL